MLCVAETGGPINVLTTHPIPYQGSKRRLAPTILELFPDNVNTLFEPFAGSSAITLACAKYEKAEAFHINDSWKPLIDIWRMVIEEPESLADKYETIWQEQHENPREYYNEIRQRFNENPVPDLLLFLLARCVKNAVRFNQSGQFNQSPDNRRKGTLPTTMRGHILNAHQLLEGHTTLSCGDYTEVLKRAGKGDLVYLDPPYQGTSGKRDQRYFEQLDLEQFVEQLRHLRKRAIPFIVSFDGQCGERSYGQTLPKDLELERISINAGRSTQATLNGRKDDTIESLYLSPDVRRV